MAAPGGPLIPRPGALAGLTALVAAAAGLASWRTVALAPVADLSKVWATDALTHLRAHACAGTDAGHALTPAPVLLTAWRRGRRLWTLQATGSDSLAELERRLRPHCDAPIRLQLDAVVAVGRVLPGALGALAFVDGSDGVRGRVEGDRWIHVPSTELVVRGLYRAYTPVPQIEPEFHAGMDLEAAAELVHRADPLGREVLELQRFRARTAVEGAEGQALVLRKATTASPELTPDTLVASARAGADYLARIQRADGQFRYKWSVVHDRDLDAGYSWPRHAAVVSTLAMSARILDAPELLVPVKRGLVALEGRMQDGPTDTRCVRSGKICRLGASALGLLAFAEHREAAGPSRRDTEGAALARYLRAMQRPDGFFHYVWRPDTGPRTAGMRAYEAQEAVLALARWGRVADDADARAAAERAMDYLAGPYWDHFLGLYIYGQEHWTCMAAEEVYAFAPKPEYARLCHRIGRFYAGLSVHPGETIFDEDVGGVGAPGVPPHLGATATVVEALVPAVALARAEGLDEEPVRAQLDRSLVYLMGGQLGPDDAFWLPAPDKAMGGFLDSRSQPVIRMDNASHAVAGMVRAVELFKE